MILHPYSTNSVISAQGDSHKTVCLVWITDEPAPRQDPCRYQHGKRDEEDDKEYNRRNQQKTPVGCDYSGILDHPHQSAEHDERERRKDEVPVNRDAVFFHPAVQEVDRDDQDDRIGQGIDNRVGLPGPDGINVVFVEEFPNHFSVR